MKKAMYYICPHCGGVTVTTGQAELICCGSKLAPLMPRKAMEGDRLGVEKVEDEWFITADHPMEKSHFIDYVIFAAGERIQLIRCYPEWDLQLRIPARGHGTLLWHCTQHGLFYQYL